MTWNRGDQIVLRWVGHRAWLDEKTAKDQTGAVSPKPGLLQGWPHVVVSDSADLLALWMLAGTATLLVDLARPGSEPLPSVWRRDTLRLMFPGRPYAITLDWTPDPSREFPEKPRALYAEQPDPTAYFRQTSRPFLGTPAHTFLGWTVNLEAPFVRTEVGVDSTDAGLDVVVTPDFAVRWRNVELFPDLIELGIYRQSDFEAFQEAGREAISGLASRRFPFDGSYLEWLPPAEWSVPQAISGWQTAPAYDLNLTTRALVPGARV